MQVHIEQVKNRSQAVLRQSNVADYRSELKKKLLSEFKANDLFVALTFNNKHKFHKASHTNQLQKFYELINRTVYGKAYEVGSRQLKSFAVEGRNNSQGMVVYLLLEKPLTNSKFKGDFSEMVNSTWVAMNWEAAKSAQEVRPVHNLALIVDFMMKQITKPDDVLRVNIKD